MVASLYVSFPDSGLFQETCKVGGELGYIYITFSPTLGESTEKQKSCGVVGDSPPSREEAFVAAARLMGIENKCNVLMGQKVETLPRQSSKQRKSFSVYRKRT